MASQAEAAVIPAGSQTGVAHPEPERQVSARSLLPRPLDAESLPAGCCRLRFERVDGATAVVTCRAESPLKVLVPRHRGPSAWAFLATYGGGLLARDRLEVDVEVGPHATALLATQAETKVYRSACGGEALQVLRARVARGGVLAVLPDPVSPFAGARYAQEQRYVLEDGASLLFLDALVAGRTARGERWAFDAFRSRTEVSDEKGFLIGDGLVLASRPGASLSDRMGRFEALAFGGIIGPAFSEGAAALLDRVGRAAARVAAPVLATASPVRGGALLRAAAVSAEDLARFLRETLGFVAKPLGDDPFQRRW